MKHYTASRVLSLRIDEGLLAGVRKRAQQEGRSVSGEIVFLVRERLEHDENAPAERRPQKITGWLSLRRAPTTHEEFRSGRAEASKALSAAVRRKARRK